VIRTRRRVLIILEGAEGFGLLWCVVFVGFGDTGSVCLRPNVEIAA
jgi:hypothetical protein